MKKLLLSLLVLFWIWLSFCSADVFNILDYFPNASCNNNTTNYESKSPYKFSVKDTTIIIKSFCFTAPLSNYSYPTAVVYSLNSWTATPTTHIYQTWSLYCVDFPDNFLISPWDVLMRRPWGYYPDWTTPNDYSISEWYGWYYWRVYKACWYRPIQIWWENFVWYTYLDNFWINLYSLSSNWPGYFWPIIYYEQKKITQFSRPM